MTIYTQDYINLILLLLAYGFLIWLSIGIAVLLRRKFWVDPVVKAELNKSLYVKPASHITAEQKYYQDVA